MVLKAVRTRDMGSYSLAHISLANVGNLLYWLYVLALPVGPVWLLHGFNTLVALLMLGLYLRHETRLHHNGVFNQEVHQQRRRDDNR